MALLRCALRLFAAAVVVAPFLHAQPKITVVGGNRFALGDVYNGATAHHLVTFRNEGKDTLLIKAVNVACGCTGTILSNDHIPPGDTGSVAVSFNSAAFVGPVEKSITLTTNDPANGHLAVYFTANAVRIFMFDPEYIFLRSGSDSTTRRTITITNTCTRTVRIRSAVPTPDILTVGLSKDVLEPGEDATLTATLKGTTPGTQAGNIELSIDFPGIPSMSLRFFAWTQEKERPPRHPGN